MGNTVLYCIANLIGGYSFPFYLRGYLFDISLIVILGFMNINISIPAGFFITSADKAGKPVSLDN